MSGYDIAMTIGGTIDDPEVGRRVVMAILESEFGPEYHEVFQDSDDILKGMQESDGGYLLAGKDVDETEAAELQKIFREVGISYKVSIGDTDDEGYLREEIWEPGYDAEIVVLDSDGDGTISLPELDAAIEKGLDAVIALRDSNKSARKLELPDFRIAPAVVERLQDLTESEWDHPVQQVKAPTPGI
jgi:hypothetical protein